MSQKISSEPLPHSNLNDLFAARVLAEPREPMVREFSSDGKSLHSQSFSAADVEILSRRVADSLLSHGKIGDRVLLCIPSGFSFAGAFFGCLRAGRVAVPMPVPGRFMHERRRVTAIAEEVGATVVLVDTQSRAGVNEWLKDQPAESFDVLDTEALEGLPLQDTQLASADADTLAVIQFTSGSTSAPKGVMLSHGNILSNVAMIARTYGLTRTDRIGGWLPNYHDMGLIGQFLCPIVLGGTAITMQPMTFLRRPHLWLRMIDAARITASAAPNFAYDLCARRVTDEQLAGLNLSRWRVALNGSEPISAAVMDRFAKRFTPAGFRLDAFAPSYGLAESTLLVTGSVGRRPRTWSTDRQDAETVRFAVSCGEIDQDAVRIVDPETRSVLPPLRIGEIWVRGASVAQGYWNAPEQTGATFSNVTACGEGPFLRTGDLGVARDGELYVVGRLKEVVIVRGKKLHPHDIEEVARLHHAFLRSGVGAAFNVSLSDCGDVVVLAHETAAGTPEHELGELASSIKLTVSREFGVDLDGVVLLRPGGVPRTTSGKVERVQMRHRFLADDIKPLHVELSPRLRSLFEPRQPLTAVASQTRTLPATSSTSLS